MSISLTPLEDKIIVKQAEAETQTASGLFIPDNAKEKPQQGEVLAVGPGRRNDAGERIPVDVKVGDKVTVEVLDVDLDRERISLSLKATQEDPWQRFARTHVPGQIVKGKVTKIVQFGVFILRRRRHRRPRAYLRAGQPPRGEPGDRRQAGRGSLRQGD